MQRWWRKEEAEEKEQVWGAFRQWFEQYHKNNPVNLKEFPRVEYWADTKREPYKEDIQHEIRKHFDKYAQDLNCCL